MAFDAPTTTGLAVSATSLNVVTKTKPDVAVFQHGRITLVSVKDTPTAVSVSAIADKLTHTYPNIERNAKVFGGLPVLRGTRFAVSDVLSAVCVYSGLENAVANYEGRYTQEQFKDAVRFARDFLLASLD